MSLPVATPLYIRLLAGERRKKPVSCAVCPNRIGDQSQNGMADSAEPWPYILLVVPEALLVLQLAAVPDVIRYRWKSSSVTVSNCHVIEAGT